MKTFASIMLFLLIGVQSFSQINQDRAFYESKVLKYTQMKKTGTVLAVVGGISFIAGIAVLANSSYIEVSDGYGNTETYTEGNPGLGAVLFLMGSGGLGAGIPLAIVGSKNKKKYESKIQTLSFKFKANPNQAGIALTYRF